MRSWPPNWTARLASRIEFTRAARDDLKEIGRFTHRRWGREQRIKYLADIERHAIELAENPEIGSLRDEIRSGVRSVPVGRHMIFYRQTDTGILILRILHASMDVSRHLR